MPKATATSLPTPRLAPVTIATGLNASLILYPSCDSVVSLASWLLFHDPAAVDDDGPPYDATALPAGEEGDQVGDILRLGHDAERRRVERRLNDRLWIGRDRPAQRGEFGRQSTGEAEHALRSRIPSTTWRVTFIIVTKQTDSTKSQTSGLES